MSLGCPAWLSFLLCLAFGCHQATESPVPEKQNQAASGSTWADAVRHFRDGRVEDGMQVGRAVADRHRREGDRLGEIRTLKALAWQLQVRGDHEQALEFAQDAVDRSNDLGDNQAIAHSLAWSGWILGEMGRCGSALVVLDQARRLSDQIGYEVGYGLSTQDMGDCYRRLGRYDLAEEALVESMSIAKKMGASIGIIEGGTMLADVRMRQGRYDEALALLTEARKLIALSDPMQTAYVEEALGRLALMRKDEIAAKGHFGEAAVWSRRHKYRRGEAMAMMGLARVAESPSDAYKLLDRSLTIFAEIHDEHEGWAMSRVGVRLVDMGKLNQGDFVLEQALEVVRNLFLRERAGIVESEQAYIAMLKGDSRKEIEKYQSAIASFEETNNLEALWRAYWKLGEAYEDDGQLPLALGNYRKAFRALKSLPPAESSPELELDRERARWELADRLRSLYDQTPQP